MESFPIKHYTSTCHGKNQRSASPDSRKHFFESIRPKQTDQKIPPYDAVLYHQHQKIYLIFKRLEKKYQEAEKVKIILKDILDKEENAKIATQLLYELPKVANTSETFVTSAMSVISYILLEQRQDAIVENILLLVIKHQKLSLQLTQGSVCFLVRILQMKSFLKTQDISEACLNFVIYTMQRHPHSREVQELGCYYLQLVGKIDGGIDMLIKKKGIASLLTSAIDTFRDSNDRRQIFAGAAKMVKAVL
jgi:hypothetical protein